MENPRIVNVEGGIVVEDGDAGLPTYVDPGTDLYDRIINGEFGSVAPYEPPPEPDPPTLEERRQGASISREAFMLWLVDNDLYDAVTAFVETQPRRVQVRWNNAQRFVRMDPELVALAAAAGFTDEQLDAAFGIE